MKSLPPRLRAMIILCGGAATALTLALHPLVLQAAGSERFDPDTRVIVGYGSQSDLPGLLWAVSDHGGSVRSVESDVGFFVVSGLGGRERVSSILSRVAPLDYVEEDARSARVMLNPNDPYYSVRQWAPQQIEAYFAWDITLGSKSVAVAVVDSGIDYNHEDLAANMWTDGSGHYGYDFVNSDTEPMDDQNLFPNDIGICEPMPVYHGTHIAGIIGAATNNMKGIAGIAQVSLMAVKVTDSCGRGFISDIAQGITYAANQGAKVIALSLGGSDYLVLRNAVRYAWDRGAVIVAATGNEGSTTISYPAAYPTVVAVGSTDRFNRRSSFSNYGPRLSLVAPGEDIYSAMVTPPFYQSHTGTSMAAPQVAGVAALVLSRNPALSNVAVRAILNSTAMDLGDPGWDVEYGYGLVNAYDAVRAALAGGLNASIVAVGRVEAAIGSNVVLSATLRDPEGKGIVGRQLDFRVDSVFVGSSTTNSSGCASIPYTIPNVWGQHTIRANFSGDANYTPSSANGVLFARAANGGNISGVVLTKDTNERVSFSEVSIPQGGIVVDTDDGGNFLIEGVPEGIWTVTADHFGFVRAYVNVTVHADRTTVVPILLGTGESIPPPPESLTLVAAMTIFMVALVTSLLFSVIYRSSRTGAKGMDRWAPPDGVPPHVADWLANTQGIDPTRLRPIEMMPVADGNQLALLDQDTGHVIVVRLDRQGQPVYVSTQ